MSTTRLSILFLLAIALGGCRTAADARADRGAAFCAAAPEQCEQRCAKCPDRDGCFASGGECGMGAVGSLDDSGDQGADVFTPGCHQEYADAACTQGQAFFGVDECTDANPRTIWEWTLSTCHLPTGDIADFDCDVECRRVGRGGGRCAWADNVCYGRRSAYCRCDVPPAPDPTVAAPGT
jgi:hypothetical protein